MDKITKLSQAIRLGATFRPQCHGGLFRPKETQHGTVLASCAVGAAIEALYGIEEIMTFRRFNNKTSDWWCTPSRYADVMERFDDVSFHLADISEAPNGRRFEHGLLFVNIGQDKPMKLIDLVELFNDYYRCTREEIADWLEKRDL